MGHIVGIDLGTTNSCVAIVKDGRPRVIEDDRGYSILPSCVAIKSKGRFTVGHGAKSLILTKPGQAVYGVKRLMGRKFRSPEVQEIGSKVGYTLLPGEDGEVLIQLADLEVTPVEVSAIILKAIRDIAEKYLDEEVTDAVITVPAHFSHRQREATMEAGRAAGMNVQRLLSEPTAAALAYGYKRDMDRRIAVYDLGGGTFDVTILEISGGVYEVLATNGDTYLGGEDFDYRIVDLLADQFKSVNGVDLRQDPIALQRLKDAAERAKCELSFVDKTPILIPRIHATHNLEATLTREDLESLVKDLIDQTIKITDTTVKEAGLSIDELDAIVLVGGQTRMPKVQESIRIFFGMKPSRGVHPEEVVAIGAAVHGENLTDETNADLLLDVTPHTLGIDTAGGFFTRVIEKNATIPVTQNRVFTTVVDNQPDVKITVRQGESTLAAENELLGQFVLGGIREAARMEPRIVVGFRIDANGILHVSAIDQDTNEKQTIEIRSLVDEGEPPPMLDNQHQGGEIAAAPPGAQPAAPAAAAPRKGFFQRLSGLFRGSGTPKAAAAPAAEAPAAEAPSEQPMAPQAPVGTDLTERGGQHDVEPRAGTEVEPRFGGGTDLTPRETGSEVAPLGPGGFDVAPRDEFESISMPAADDDDATAVFNGMGPRADVDPVPVAMPAPAAIDPLEDMSDLEYSDMSALDALDEALADDSLGLAPRQPQPGDGIAADLRASLFPDAGGPRAGDTVIEPDPFLDENTGSMQDARTLPPGIDTQGMTKLDAPLVGLAEETPDALDEEDLTVPRVPEDEFDPAEDDLSAVLEAALKATEAGAFAEDPDLPAVRPDHEVAPRKKRRKPARLRIRYKRAATFVSEYRENLERGGTFIKTGKPLAKGRSCLFEITVPGEPEALLVRGEVVWSSKGLDALDPDQPPGMGIEYDADDQAGLEALRAALQRHA